MLSYPSPRSPSSIAWRCSACGSSTPSRSARAWHSARRAPGSRAPSVPCSAAQSASTRSKKSSPPKAAGSSASSSSPVTVCGRACHHASQRLWPHAIEHAIEQQLAMPRRAEPVGIRLQGLDAERAACERAWTRVGAASLMHRCVCVCQRAAQSVRGCQRPMQTCTHIHTPHANMHTHTHAQSRHS